jgi:ubiquinone/menaquinone biosynthesis C-methylase UbiE
MHPISARDSGSGAGITFVCPATRQPLEATDHGLRRPDGLLYPYLTAAPLRRPIAAFFEPGDPQAEMSQYAAANAEEIYDNFLDWLFATFRADEREVRSLMAQRLALAPGAAVLVTGCGLGDDIPCIHATIGNTGVIFAQDLSIPMVLGADRRLAQNNCRVSLESSIENVHLFVGDATRLPFADATFDAALHFGGINEFPDKKTAIAEMTRVVRQGGRVCFGDEGVAPWLRNTEFGRMMVENNGLWRSEPPLDLLPEGVRDCRLSWILGNCFYLVDFEVGSGPPEANIDIRHKGRRGGSIRTRYYGRLEGVDPDTKKRVYEAAAADKMSVKEWIEAALQARLERGS